MKEQDCELLIEGCPKQCSVCDISLCLRQQVLSLALGYVKTMYCLNCLGRENQKDPAVILDDLKIYIDSREWFKRQWVKDLDDSFCPHPKECYPSVCFMEQ